MGFLSGLQDAGWDKGTVCGFLRVLRSVATVREAKEGSVGQVFAMQEDLSSDLQYPG